MGTSTSKEKDNNSKNKADTNNKDFKVTTKLVIVRIQINSNMWEKAFNIEETLENIAQNFKTENDMDTINKNYFIEWTFNNFPIEMNTKKLKDFIVENNIKDGSPIEICQKIKPKVGKNNINALEICDIVGKPLFNPFEIIIFITNQKIIKIKTYNKRYISQNELDKFSIESAYCNGNNYLFISGGVDSSTRAPLDLFWEIDLKSDNLNNPIKMGIQKKNHSMIYSEKKVFIVGGDNENCIFYDIETKTINNLGNLNIKRFEPSLIKYENYIFCFDSARKKNNNRFSLEKINLNNLSNPVWEIIYPNISPSIGENVYNQKFFGVVEDYKQNIIFLGGIYDNTRSLNYEDNSEKMNTRYNISKNLIEKSDIPYKEISLSEKTFLPLDDKIFFILPNFTKRSPKIIYYNRDNNEIKISNYTSNTTLIKKRKNNNIKPNTQIIASLSGLNFDMPGLHKENVPNINNNKNDDLIVDSRNNNDITMNNPNLFKNESSIAFNDNKRSINNNINMDIKFKQKNNNNNILEIKSDQNNNFNQKINDINLKDNIFNENINIDGNINPNIDVSIKPNINNKNIYNENINIDGNINPNTDVSIKPNINNNNNIDLNIPRTDINMNSNSNLDLNTNTNLGISTNKNNLDIKTNNELIKNPSININGGIEINNPNDIKIEMQNSIVQNDKNKEIKETIYYPKTERFYNDSKVHFHNSVDDPCNNIKRIKVKNLPYPDPISMKLIKKKAKEVLKEEKNKLRINNY